MTTVLTNSAAAASRALAAVWAANPVGVVITALAGVTAALKLYSDNTKEAIALEKQRITLAAQIAEAMKQHEKQREIVNNKVQDYNQLSIVEQNNLKKEILLRHEQLQAQIKNIQARKMELEQMAQVPTVWQKAMAMLKSGGNMSAYTAALASYAGDNIVEVNKEFNSQIDSLKSGLQSYEQMMGQISKMDKQASDLLNQTAPPVPPGGGDSTSKGGSKSSSKESATKEGKAKADLDSRFDIKPKDMSSQLDSDMKEGFGIAMIPVDDKRADQERNLKLAEASGDLSEAEIYQKKLEAEEQYLTSKLLLEETYGQSSVETQRQLADVAVDIEAQRIKAEIEGKEKLKEAELLLQEAKREALFEGISALKEFFDESTVIFKALLIGEKAIAVADIIIKAQKEIAGYYEKYSFPGGTAIATGLAIATGVRSAASIAKITAATKDAVAKKAVGGYTDTETLTRETGGYVSKATLFQTPGRKYIAGEAGTEFILSNRSLQHPAVAQFAGMMDSIQKTRNYSALDNISGGGSADISVLIAEMRNLGGKVDALANRPIQFPVTRFHEAEEFLMRIENEVNA